MPFEAIIYLWHIYLLKYAVYVYKIICGGTFEILSSRDLHWTFACRAWICRNTAFPRSFNLWLGVALGYPVHAYYVTNSTPSPLAPPTTWTWSATVVNAGSTTSMGSDVNTSLLFIHFENLSTLHTDTCIVFTYICTCRVLWNWDRYSIFICTGLDSAKLLTYRDFFLTSV